MQEEILFEENSVSCLFANDNISSNINSNCKNNDSINNNSIILLLLRTQIDTCIQRRSLDINENTPLSTIKHATNNPLDVTIRIIPYTLNLVPYILFPNTIHLTLIPYTLHPVTWTNTPTAYLTLLLDYSVLQGQLLYPVWYLYNKGQLGDKKDTLDL